MSADRIGASVEMTSPWTKAGWPWSWRRLLLSAVGAQTAITLVITLSVAPFGLGWLRLAGAFSRGLIFANCITAAEAVIWLVVWKPVMRFAPVPRILAALGLYSLGVHAGVLLALGISLRMGTLPAPGYWSTYWEMYFQPVTVLTLAIGGAISIIVSAYATMQYRSRYELAQGQLRSLESRLHPHFLFNTLNSIRTLIMEDPAAAEQLVLRLSALLRSSLDLPPGGTFTLERELQLTRDYLAIEHIRFGPRFTHTIAAEPGLGQAAVPPFALQTLVENSVKYGGSDIRVQARSAGGSLVLEVWDSGNPSGLVPVLQPGHGLQTLQARIALLWGAGAAIEFPSSAEGTTVRLTLPMRTM
ncbi:MAG TPA: histidine kinase [Bryobacteraceae bacterium]|nr:histidine kinase [Bryobacteraceae bacterium]